MVKLSPVLFSLACAFAAVQAAIPDTPVASPVAVVNHRALKGNGGHGGGGGTSGGTSGGTTSGGTTTGGGGAHPDGDSTGTGASSTVYAGGGGGGYYNNNNNNNADSAGTPSSSSNTQAGSRGDGSMALPSASNSSSVFQPNATQVPAPSPKSSATMVMRAPASLVAAIIVAVAVHGL